VIDSTTEEVFATIPAGVPADIDRAVAAAKAAFDG
jgi:aldehyde dehydrogenase (NAD+)